MVNKLGKPNSAIYEHHAAAASRTPAQTLPGQRRLEAGDGRITFDGYNLAAWSAASFACRPERDAIQMVFQDPTDSLNPRYTARRTNAEPLRLLAGLGNAAAQARVNEVALQVGLPPQLLARLRAELGLS